MLSQYLPTTLEEMKTETLNTSNPPFLVFMYCTIGVCVLYVVNRFNIIPQSYALVALAIIPMLFCIYMYHTTNPVKTEQMGTSIIKPKTKDKDIDVKRRDTERRKKEERENRVRDIDDTFPQNEAGVVSTSGSEAGRAELLQKFEDSERGVLRNRRGQVNKNGVLPSNDDRLGVVQQEFTAFRTSEFDSRYSGMPKQKTNHPQAPPMMRYEAKDGPGAGQGAKNMHSASGPQTASSDQSGIESMFKTNTNTPEDEEDLLKRHLERVRSSR